MPSANPISSGRLVRLLGTPRGPASVDVRTDDGYIASPSPSKSCSARFVDGIAHGTVSLPGIHIRRSEPASCCCAAEPAIRSRAG